MCNDRSWKSCSIVTIVFTTMLMLGMFISVGVMNSMFGDNMQCYVDATNDASNSRRQMVEGMDKIAAQHPSGDGIAAGKLALFNIAQTFGLGPAVKQLPAFRSLAPEGRKLSETPPNDNSCASWNLNDGVCDDINPFGMCDCGTDLNDCGYRFSSEDCTASPPPPPYSYNSGGGRTTYSEQTDEQRVEEAEKVRCPPPTSLRAPPCFLSVPADLTVPSTHPPFLACPRAQAVLDVFNPAMIVPAIFSSLFLYIGSGLTLKNVTEPRTLPAALTCLLHCDKPGGVSQPPGACGSASAHPPPPSPPAAGAVLVRRQRNVHHRLGLRFPELHHLRDWHLLPPHRRQRLRRDHQTDLRQWLRCLASHQRLHVALAAVGVSPIELAACVR